MNDPSMTHILQERILLDERARAQRLHSANHGRWYSPVRGAVTGTAQRGRLQEQDHREMASGL